MDIILRVAATAGGAASAEASKAKKRKQESDRYVEEMKKLKPRVDNAHPASKKKFDSLYSKIFDLGEAAFKAAEKLVRQYADKIEEDTDEDSAIQMLEQQIRWWRGNVPDHFSKSKDSAYGKMFQAEVTWGYATKLDEWIITLDQALKGDWQDVRPPHP